MSQKNYKVIQWATGEVGKVALRHFVDNPAFDLVGVFVTNPQKIGKDAGEIAGIGETGVIATGNPEAIIAMDADCVHFSPLVADIDMVCRLLRSGKNVVSPLGPFYNIERYRADVDKIEAACRDGETSFHGSGIHPGFGGNILPLISARLMSRIDQLRIYEIVNFQIHPSHWAEVMGFGRDPVALTANPSRSPEAGYSLSQDMAMIAEALGAKIEKLTTEIKLAVATKDIPYATGVIRAGTVAGQHYEWTGWVEGRPLIKFFTIWKMGHENMEPNWDCGDSRYQVTIDGEPPLELTLTGTHGEDGKVLYPGLAWTALAGVTAIPDVCDAAPGFVTHMELGMVRPRGLLRPVSRM
jgi:2,4-diaminopentanoate dehydrogenase